MPATDDKPRFFERAREEVDLLSFVQGILNVKGVRMGQGRSVRWPCCPICGESSDKHSVRFSVKDGKVAQCFACDFKGGVVDLAAKVWGVQPLDAAKRLLMEDRPAVVIHMERKVVDYAAEAAAMKEVLTALRAATTVPQVASMDYLMGRGLSRATLDAAFERGILGMLPSTPADAVRLLLDVIGKEKLIQVGLWGVNDDGTPKKMPGIAFRPIIFFLPGCESAEFRINHAPAENERKSIRYGSAQHPWFWRGTEPGITTVEGPIDMLSMVDLGYKGSIVGVAGVKNWRVDWFQKLVASQVGSSVTIAFDNDATDPKNPGQTWATKLLNALKDVGIPCRINTPPSGDINDLLKQRVFGLAA